MIDEALTRFWESMGGRVGGPLTFRLVIQPIVAALLAARHGVADAREGKPPYGWALFSGQERRVELLAQGFRAVIRVFALAIIIDAVYQWIVFRWFYPFEALFVAIVLALLPYLLVRGPANRIAGRVMKHKKERPSA